MEVKNNFVHVLDFAEDIYKNYHQRTFYEQYILLSEKYLEAAKYYYKIKDVSLGMFYKNVSDDYVIKANNLKLQDAQRRYTICLE